jgi:hypothetical protein
MYEVDVLVEKLHLAVVSLASGTTPVQERLADAFVGALADLKPNDFPPELAEDFDQVRQEIIHHAPKATAEGELLDESAAQALARRIVSLYDRLNQMNVAEEVETEQ